MEKLVSLEYQTKKSRGKMLMSYVGVSVFFVCFALVIGVYVMQISSGIHEIFESGFFSHFFSVYGLNLINTLLILGVLIYAWNYSQFQKKNIL